MANTTNLNLVKPAGTDKALVSVLNSNSDKIDAFAGTTNQALSNVNNALSGADIINNQSDKDLNHYITTKAWRIGNVSQLTNGPVWTLAGATGDLYVRANGTYISQLFIGNAGLASRLSADGGSTWNDWVGYAPKGETNAGMGSALPNLNNSPDGVYGFGISAAVTVDSTSIPAGTRFSGYLAASIGQFSGISPSGTVYIIRCTGSTWSWLKTIS